MNRRNKKLRKQVLGSFRAMALANGPLKEKTKGSPKGKRGYTRKSKHKERYI